VSSVMFVPYEISERCPVFLKILDNKNQEVLSVVDVVLDAGRYVAAVNTKKLQEGKYTYLLIAGARSQKRTFDIAR